MTEPTKYPYGDGVNWRYALIPIQQDVWVTMSVDDRADAFADAVLDDNPKASREVYRQWYVDRMTEAVND